jgi:hypothetical protein
VLAPAIFHSQMLATAMIFSNLLQHSLMFDQFIACGLPKAQFFHDSDSPDDLKLFAGDLDRLIEKKTFASYARGAWCRIYFAQWMSKLLGFGDQTKEALLVGQQRFSRMDEDVRWMENWFNEGKFRNPDLFAKSTTELLTYLGFEIVPFFKVNVSTEGIEFVEL